MPKCGQKYVLHVFGFQDLSGFREALNHLPSFRPKTLQNLEKIQTGRICHWIHDLCVLLFLWHSLVRLYKRELPNFCCLRGGTVRRRAPPRTSHEPTASLPRHRRPGWTNLGDPLTTETITARKRYATSATTAPCVCLERILGFRVLGFCPYDL